MKNSNLGNRLEISVNELLRNAYSRKQSLRYYKTLYLLLSKIERVITEDMTEEQIKSIVNNKVYISDGELENALGISFLNKSDVLDMLEFFKLPIELSVNYYTKIVIHICEGYVLRKCNGKWDIEFVFSEEIIPFLFTENNRAVSRIRSEELNNVTSLQSLLLYCYLSVGIIYDNSWTISISELRSIIECTDYDEFAVFNRDVLKKCHKEITDKTSLRYEYKVIRKDRKADSIRFTVINNEEVLRI